MTDLVLTGICKSFAGTAVLEGIDLAVPAGSTLALLGPSGSGKSTILRIAAGLEAPDAGSVTIGDVEVTRTPTHERGVGVVFQDQALFPHLDVGGNVAFGLRMAGWAKPRRVDRVAEVLGLVGLDGYERRDPATLSGGEAQRVALARALAPGPEVLLLDEPLAALDQLLRERLLLELRGLFRALQLTVVSVTHDPTEAAALGDRIAVLTDGRIVQVGAPGEVLATPISAAVAGLVGHRNVTRATVTDGTIESPWGTFPTEHGNGPTDILVPPDAIEVSGAGSLVGTVTGLLHRGGSPFAVVSGTDWPPLDVPVEPGWAVGDQVRIAIDAARVVTLEPGPGPAR